MRYTPIRRIQAVMTKPGLVFDPYSGSGTTGIVAALFGHDFIGFDSSETYNRMAMQRIANPSKNDLRKFNMETEQKSENVEKKKKQIQQTARRKRKFVNSVGLIN